MATAQKLQRSRLAPFFMALVVTVLSATAEDLKPHTTPNYRQAAQYSSSYLGKFLYDTSVRPRWIGKTDEFWYSYRTSQGTQYTRVNPMKRTQTALFDRVKLGGQLGELIKKPVNPKKLPITRVSLDEGGKELTFVVDKKQYLYVLATEKLTLKGNAPAQSGFSGQSSSSREEFLRRLRERGINPSGSSRSSSSHRVFSPDRRSYIFAKGHNLFRMDLPKDYVAEEKSEKETPKESTTDEDKSKKSQETKSDDKKSSEQKTAKAGKSKRKRNRKKGQDRKKKRKKKATEQDKEKSKENEDSKKESTKESKSKKDGSSQDNKKKSDKDLKQNEKKDGDKETKNEKDSDKEKEIPIPKVDDKTDDKATQLTNDGVEDYTYAGRSRRSRSQSRTSTTITDSTKTRPSVRWSKDSKSFYVTRRDSRGVEDLWVINSLANPRPTLEKYSYPMPGEENIRTSELYYYNTKSKKLERIEPKWKDEGYSDVQFGRSGDELRFVRRDRLLRNIEVCVLNVNTGESKCIIEEGFENSFLFPQSIRYLKDTDEMIWWSERSGWAHLYLYDRDGNLKNPVTSGEFRTSRIVDVDEKNRVVYFIANGREKEENIYFNHLYSVRLDGTDLTLLDPGNANHSSTLSPSKRFLVDNCSRVDMPPVSVVRATDGSKAMDLESADMSRLAEVGWKCPSTFVVKAADGYTDLYGNMWKPFNFDPKKKYPIIAHVYPGPQQEGTRHTFSATAGEQQLAQLGFIVIQVGHRGGAPYRSKTYASYGYSNLRDYGLADKKAAIEQLAQQNDFIDVERVGLYGHSGGGFMTAAALLREPYNSFFKVGVSTAGNHDNNIYNNSWSERYHGLKQVDASKAKKEAEKTSDTSRSSTSRTSRPQIGRRGTYDVSAADHFYEFELMDEQWGLGASLDREFWESISSSDAIHATDELWIPIDDDDKKQKKNTKAKSEDDKSKDSKKTGQDKKETDQEGKGTTTDKSVAKDKTKQGETKEDSKEEKKKGKFDDVKFEIDVPTNVELAANLKGHLFLVHGELDNNVHPANTLRLVDALIKANKRFDMLYLPSTRHGFGQYRPYVTQRMYEYFAEHLLNDYQAGPDIEEKRKNPQAR